MNVPAGLDSPVVTAALTAAASATGMELVFIGGVTELDFTFQRVLGSWPGLTEGARRERADSFCARLLDGAPTASADVGSEPEYASVSSVGDCAVVSYVGVPIRDEQGRVLGTLCGMDSSPVEVGDSAVQVLGDLATLIATHLRTVPSPGVLIRRTPQGWQVESPAAGLDGSSAPEPEPELTTALTLADLLADDGVPLTRPLRPENELDAIEQLQLSVAQLEHALAARVTVEQAIGVLAERQQLIPRAAFERLRKAARSRGRRVHVLAGEVVASAQTPGIPLPPELAGRRTG